MIEAKRFAAVSLPGNPQASYSAWRVIIRGTDAFRLQANILTMLDTLVQRGGCTVLRGIPYRTVLR